MRLLQVTIDRFRNFTSPQTIDIEPDVTCFVGKNESGKTTLLKALHRLNPANGTDLEFKQTPEYPMARLSRDRRSEDLDLFSPVSAEFSLTDEDSAEIASRGYDLLPATRVIARRTYGNELQLELKADFPEVVKWALEQGAVKNDDDEERLTAATTYSEWEQQVEVLLSDIKGEAAPRAKAVRDVKKRVVAVQSLLGPVDSDDLRDLLTDLLPKFFYFSEYSILPGECDLTALHQKMGNRQPLSENEQTVVALLAFADEEPSSFMDEDYVSRKAELQAASADLSERVFEFWKQNTDLAVVFETDMPLRGTDPQGREIRPRVLLIQLRDERHGGVETNFGTRSAGFQWFFSFLAAFSAYQSRDENVIVLLDEPGTSLHGEAQKDFVRYIYQELGQSQQVLYTTHSQFMIDPTRYETIRAVHDQATRDDKNAGVVVTLAGLSADRDTTLPVEAALGYTITQHLILGTGNHLVVEGGSDFVYLTRVSEHLKGQGRTGLDPRMAILPVGGIDNVAPFVAMFGRRIPLTVLIDGEASSRQRDRIAAAAKSGGKMEPSKIVLCVDALPNGPKKADIEDLFDLQDYLWLYSRTFDVLTANDLATTTEPVIKRIQDVRGKFDHALPAYKLTEASKEFFEQVQPTTLDNFEALFRILNATLDERPT